ncbi:MAG: hypothetical protein ACE5D8_03300 [Fidelibacterota bacterium]
MNPVNVSGAVVKRFTIRLVDQRVITSGGIRPALNSHIADG